MSQTHSLPLPVAPQAGPTRHVEARPLSSSLRGLARTVPALLSGAALAFVLHALFAYAGAPLRAEAALLALAAFVYVGAPLAAGRLSLLLGGVLNLGGFFALAHLGLREGAEVMALGYWLHAAWGLMLATALRQGASPLWPAWLGLHLGMAVAVVI